MTRLVGSTLSNRYEIIERLGEGGMAIVYRAKDRVLGRRVAIKVLRPQFAADTDFVERFRREAQAAASLSHPNVVNIFDVGTDGEVHFIVMEYVEGRNLKQTLREDGPMPARKALLIGQEVCRALEAAHAQGLIHRDIKPHNILVTKDCQVKVTDFGIARAASSATLTHTGTMIGSVHYLSPEQATGKQVGVFSDIYSVGVLLYEMITGKVPFDGDSPVAVALKHLQDEPTSPRVSVPDLPEPLEALILRSMAKDPAQRYATISELLAELRTVAATLTSGDVSDPPAGIPKIAAAPVPPPKEPDPAPRASDDATIDTEHPTVVANLGSGSPLDEAAVGTDSITAETTIVRRPNGQAAKPDKRLRDEEGQQVPAKKPKRRSMAFRVMMWVVFLLSFASGVVWAGVSFFDRLFPEDVVVPGIVGMSVDEARTLLSDRGLGLRIAHEVNSDQPVNTIIRQIPDAERTVKMGREIDVHISIGKAIVETPDLTMLSEREAMLRLVQNGLELGSVSYEYRPDVAPNLVVAHSPEVGARIQRGSRVDLVFSTGAEPVPMVQIPDFRGVLLDEAIDKVEELGLVLGETFAEVDANFSPGEVTDQAPAPGTEVEVGSAVNFVYYPKAQTQGGGAQPGPSQPQADPSTPDGDTWVQSLITINVPPGPEQEVEIVIIDNISARRVYYGVHRGDARISQIIRGRGKDAMYQVWIGGELHGQGPIAEAR